MNYNKSPPTTTLASSNYDFDHTQTITQHFGNISINDPLQNPDAQNRFNSPAVHQSITNDDIPINQKGSYVFAQEADDQIQEELIDDLTEKEPADEQQGLVE